MGKANPDCSVCICQDHTVLGSVRSAGSLPAPGAAILLSGTSPKLLALTDHNGHFRAAGVCPDGNTTLTIKLQNHTPQTITMKPSSEMTTVLHVKMDRASNDLNIYTTLCLTLFIRRSSNHGWSHT